MNGEPSLGETYISNVTYLESVVTLLPFSSEVYAFVTWRLALTIPSSPVDQSLMPFFSSTTLKFSAFTESESTTLSSVRIVLRTAGPQSSPVI